jgi:D-3-phosphoglycerate dehydrogenase
MCPSVGARRAGRPMPLKVLVTDDTSVSFDEERAVFAPFGIELVIGSCQCEEDLIRAGLGVAGFLVSNVPVTRRVLEALPELRVIVKYGIGIDNIDLVAAAELGKVVARVPGYCREEVALHALSLALNGLRRTHLLGAQVAGGRWNDYPQGLILYRASEVRLGIVGLGSIGGLFARYAQRLFQAVHYYDPYVWRFGQARRYRRERSLAALFEQCAVVSLHAPLTPQTRGFIGGAALSRARQSILINTSRAGIVEREALEQALDTRRLSFYGADLFWEEPPNRGDSWTGRFLQREDVLITPHSAWYSPSANREVKRRAAEEVLRVLQGRRPLGTVRATVQS